jgi:hypothetical protein
MRGSHSTAIPACRSPYCPGTWGVGAPAKAASSRFEALPAWAERLVFVSFPSLRTPVRGAKRSTRPVRWPCGA